MSYLIAYLLIGVTAVAILMAWALRGREPSAAEQADPVILLMEALENRPQTYAYKIFDEEDWKFVCRVVGAEDRKAFAQDRTRLALVWLRGMRGRAARILRLHRQAARSNAGLKSGWEFRVAANYLYFLLLCGMLHMAIRARGPFHVRRITEPLLVASDRLWLGSEGLVRFLDRSVFSSVGLTEK